MKKLVMFTSAVTIAAGAFAWTFCGPDAELGECEIPVWDFKASGKVANEGSRGYKSVNKVSLKGVIVGNIDYREATPETVTTNVVTNAGEVVNNTNTTSIIYTNNVGSNVTIEAGGAYTNADTVTTNEVVTPAAAAVCCLESFNVYIYERAARVLVRFEEQEVAVLTAFGKYLNDIVAKTTRPGRGYTLESDVMWTLTEDDCDGGAIDLQFVGFGRTKGGVTAGRDNTSPCGDNSIAGCQVRVDWPSWKGWFTGWYGDAICDLTSPKCDFDCELVEAVAGGTWTAKYNKKRSGLTSVAALESAMESAFRATVVELADLCYDID